MSKPRAAFLQIDVTRAVRGVAAAGVRVTRVEIDPITGQIVVSCGLDEAASNDAASAFDEWKSGRAR